MKYNLTEDQLCDNKFMKEFLETVVTELVDTIIANFRGFKKETLLNEHGMGAFLDSENCMFPIINPKTNKLDETLVYVGALKAIVDGNTDILQTAKNIIENEQFKDIVTITIGESDMEFGLLDKVLEFVWENNLQTG